MNKLQEHTLIKINILKTWTIVVTVISVTAIRRIITENYHHVLFELQLRK